jgi:hypothetical protein
MVRNHKRKSVSICQLKGKLSVQATKAGMAVHLHSFLNSALDGGDWSASYPGVFSPEKRVLDYKFTKTNLV